MKVLLFEQWSGGHYANYLNCLVPALAQTGASVVVSISKRMRQTNESVQAWAELGNVEFTSPLPEVAPQLRFKDRQAATRNFLACIDSVQPDFTLLPSADAQSTWLAGMKSLGLASGKRLGPIEGTFHYGYGLSAESGKEKFKEFVYSETYRRVPFASVNFVNSAYFEYAVSRRLLPRERARLIGDPVPQPPRIGKAVARRLLGLEADGRYMGLLGQLDRRKAIPQLLLAFRRARLGSTDRLLLAGKLDPGYAKLIRNDYADLTKSGRLVVIDRFLSNDELGCGFEALDLATVVYDRFPGLASLALKAIAAGTPVIGHDFGWLASTVRRFDVGRVVNVFDVQQFADALPSALDMGGNSVQNEGVRRLMAFHAEGNFVNGMLSGLRRFMGEPSAAVVDWNWVLEAVTDSTPRR